MANQFNTLDMIPILTDVSRGKIAGAEPFGSYGEITTSGSSSGVLWPDGVYSFPPAGGTQMSVTSTSSQDGTAGTGALTIDIHYVDTDLIPNVETVIMAGTTPVLTVATNIRFIQCMHVLAVGSTKSAAGVISASVGGQIYSQITAGSRRCSSSVRMVPKGKRLLVTSMFGGSISGTAGAGAIIRISTPSFEGHDFISDGIFMPLFSATFQDSSSGLTIPVPLSFTQGQVVGMTFSVDKAATIVGSWFGWLEDM